MSKTWTVAMLASALSLAGARTTFAQEAQQAEVEQAVEVGAEAQAEVQAPVPPQSAPPPGAPVPPSVEDAPYAAPAGGGYCYGGAHPVDTRVEAGPAWDESQGTHLHQYPPFDLRLFVLRDGCYYFVGDPTDFGYRGQTYQYYGAHPVLDLYGGGWCFMIAGHAHWWRPWSPYFTMAGPWFYWYGPYDAFFWGHWPYYAHYYRAYYPRYYGGGRFYRGSRRDRLVAPPVGRVPTPPARAMAAAGGGFSSSRGGGAPVAPTRGSANRAPGWSSPATPARTAGDVPSLGWSSRPGPTRQVAPSTSPIARDPRSGFSAAPNAPVRAQPREGFQGDASGWSGYRSAPAATAPVFRSPAPSAPSPGWSAPSGGFRAPAPSTPSFRSAPAQSAPSFRSAPSSSSAPSFRSGGGGSRSGGGGGGWRR